MVAERKQWLAFGAGVVALLAIAAGSCLGAGYTYAGAATPASQGPSGYVAFAAVEPSTQGPSGWVGPGQYSLPPDVGGVGIGVSAAGSTVETAGSPAGQELVVRLAVAVTGNQLFTIDPSGARLSDDAAYVVVGATVYSNNLQVAQISLGPGGRDDLQLAFSLPSTINVAALAAFNVDLPYQYGGRSAVAHFRFAPAPAGIGGGGAASYTPTYQTYTYNDYYSQPGSTDYSPGYTGGWGWSSWWAPSWGWPGWGWWCNGWGAPWRWSFAFDADDFVGRHRHHRLEELREHQQALPAADPAARAAATNAPAARRAEAEARAAQAGRRGNEHAVEGRPGATAAGTTPGAVTNRPGPTITGNRAGEREAMATGRGERILSTAPHTEALTRNTAERPAPRVLMAPRVEPPRTAVMPRTGERSRVFVAPGAEIRGAEPQTFAAPPAATPRPAQPRVFNAPRTEAPRFESAPRSFAAPAPRFESAPRSFAAPAPRSSSSPGFRGGGSFAAPGGGGSFAAPRGGGSFAAPRGGGSSGSGARGGVHGGHGR